MNFHEFRFEPIENESLKGLLLGELMELGFESYAEEEGECLLGYIAEDHYRQGLLDDCDFLKDNPLIKVTEKVLDDKNWNEEWEKNYNPVLIDGKCFVRAPFHEPMPGARYEIVIEPKMAFGTAHHETTQLMATWLMEQDIAGQTVLDMGCGTGILAILANKMGASYVKGIDNDEWAWRNALENFRLNGVAQGDVLLGDVRQVEKEKYDLVLANINRNILLQDLPDYAEGLKAGGKILLSGFYESDRDSISKKTGENGLRFIGIKSLNLWAAMLFIKA
jgi:ribosomal protein L11 methyltransferase